MESILLTIKKKLGIEAEYTHFDEDIIVEINSAFMALNDIGVGPESTFYITGVNELWSDFLGKSKDLEAVKTYIYIKCRIVFDPPQSSFVLEALKEQAKEYEWRLSNRADKN